MRDKEKEEQLFVFAKKVFHRVEGRPDPIFPPDYHVDWADRPAPFRHYPAQPHIALPLPNLVSAGGLDWASMARGNLRPTLEELSLLLFLLAGPQRRNLDIDWNSKEPLTKFRMQQFRRGTTAGGGLYPVQHYLVVERGHGIPQGVYHYATAQHAFVALRNGPWARRLAQAVSATDHGAVHGVYLVLSVDYWLNSFKYHNFGYHVVCEDVGAMAATAHLISQGLGFASRNFIAFDDVVVDEVIGADGRGESAFAVIGLGATAEQELAPSEVLTTLVPIPFSRPRQISRRVDIAPEFERVHRLSHLARAALADAPPAAEPFRSPALSLENLISALTTRQSAWGSMWSENPIGSDELRTLLTFISDERSSPEGELAQAFGSGEVGICLQALRVSGLPPGAYRWDQQDVALHPLDSTPPVAWQDAYHMKNYNLDEAACIVFVTGNMPRVLSRYGVRGFRTLNAYVGMIAQLSYVAAAHLGLDCGVALGVCAQRVKGILHLPDAEDVILAIFLSKNVEHYRFFDFRLLH